MIYIIELIIVVVMSNLLRMLWDSYGMPSKWVFNNRYLLDSLLAGIGMILILSILHYYSEHRLEMRFFKIVITGFILVVLFGVIATTIIFKKLCKKTKLVNLEGEEEIMSDDASLKNEYGTIRGRLILTNKRLCFIAKETNYNELIFNLSEFTKEPEIAKRWIFPSGIHIQDKDMNIYFRFRRYWMKEIKELVK